MEAWAILPLVLPVWAIWVPVIAALGASLITGFIAFGLDFIRRHSERKAQWRLERRDAYAHFISAAANLMFAAGGLRLTLQLRSGLAEGLEVVRGARKAIDPWEFTEQLRRDVIGPLNDAWSRVWLFGTEESITAANDVVMRSTEVVGTATRSGTARTGLLRIVLGERWTPAEDKAYAATVRDFGIARKRFAEVARKEIGAEVVDLFAGVESAAD